MYLSDTFRIFALNSSAEYGEKIARHLGIKLNKHVEKCFEDGEVYLRSEENVRGCDVYVVASLYTDYKESVNEKLIKLLFFIGSLKDASANKVTAVIPSLSYSRQDRKVESRAPISTKYVSHLLESMSCSHILVLDVHNLAVLQNSFSLSCPADNLECKNLYADWCASRLIDKSKIVILSPDAGGYQRAERFRTALSKRLNINIGVAILDKLRIDGKVQAGRIVGDVENADVIIYDDIISTGGTIYKACKTAMAHGGKIFAICATHGLFTSSKVNDYLNEINCHIVISDSMSPFRLDQQNFSRLHIIDTSQMMSEAIWRIHSGTGSISELLK